MPGYRFYLAPVNGGREDCFEWKAQGVLVELRGVRTRWIPITSGMVSPGAIVRVSYTYGGKYCTQELMFPVNDTLRYLGPGITK